MLVVIKKKHINNSSYNMPAYVPSEAANDNTRFYVLWDDLQSTSSEVPRKEGPLRKFVMDLLSFIEDV